jgi:hypothetical protein
LFSISVEFDGFYWGRMTFKNSAMSGCIVIPYPNGGVSRATCNKVAGRIDADVVNWAFMSCEFVGASVGFQRGGEDNAVVGSRDYLLHIWTEDTLSDFVFVFKERLYKVRVC